MIKYYKSIGITFNEIIDAPSLFIHALTGCPFNCFKCFNYDELIAKQHEKYYLIEDIIDNIKKQNDIIKYIIISGAEILNASLSDLINDFSLIKKATNHFIIIYTTGVDYEKLKYLYDNNLIDGIHLDMKLPYHLLDENDEELIKMTLGKNIRIDIIKEMQKSVIYTVSNDKGYNQIRSVKYPFLDDSAFLENKRYIEELNSKYGKSTPYFANKFVDPSLEEEHEH